MRTQQPSRTAQSVAANILVLSYDPVFGALVPPEAVEPTRWFLGALPGLAGKSVTLIDHVSVRACARRIERWVLPGIALQSVLRKRWIEAKVREALAGGCAQIVVLGAGFDTLAYRLHRAYPAACWWEIDHPATQQVKRRALDAQGGVHTNLTLLPVDFTQQSLTAVLASTAGYDRGARTLFIAEGLLMYLAEADVRALLRTIHEQSGLGSGLVGTILAPWPDGRLAIRGASRLVEILLRRIGEPFRWGIAPEALPAFLQASALGRVEIAHTRDILARSLPSADQQALLIEEEYLFLATNAPDLVTR